jgi:pimeloyl-ACP methyl ester carboxylesterase
VRDQKRGRDGRQATTLVAVNGLGALQHLWDGFHAALPPSVGLRVLDLPGHGDRPPAADYRYAALVDDVLARTADLPPFPLAGWSVGGAVAWLVAARRPERVTGLVLLDPAAPHQSPFKDGPTPEPVHPFTYATARDASRALAAIDPTTTEEDVRRSHRVNAQGLWEPRFDPAIFPALVEDARDNGDAFRAELGAITAPTLVLCGERSFVRPGQLSEIMGGIPGAREATVRGAGHFMVREQPEQVARIVVDFLGLS